MLRTIPRAALGGSLTLIRLPVGGVLRLAGGGEAAGLALDRAEASVRSVAGFALSDNVLIEDAARRRDAADERERALRLRAEADRHAQRAEQRVSEGKAKADRTRTRAAENAARQTRGAQEHSEARQGQAAKAARERQAAAAKSAALREEEIDERAKRARLDNLDTRAEALEEKEEALTAADESRRLREGASRAKAERKAKDD